ncbi:MAG: GTP-binding protein, partial [Clostridia bacterium]|nr:GTP-binding protein [Clostridia bacterium]
MSKSVKINIISGFLGAGKTTLIKKLLTGSLRNEKVILLENEYGEVGVDASFMKDAGITVTELNSGCICCTLAGDFQKAIDELIDTYHPERIIIEPTGVGKLSEIISAVQQAKARHEELDVGGCATVVDAGKCRMYMKNFGEFFLDQVKSASTIIFSRTQNLTPERVEKSRLLIAEAHPDARIITTPWDDMEPDFMLDVIENGKPIEIELDEHDHDDDEDEHEHHHHHHHDHEDHDEDEHEHHHHHDHDDDDEDEHEHHHHHDHDEHDHDDEDEHEHHHHHDHDEHDHDEDEHDHHH